MSAGAVCVPDPSAARAVLWALLALVLWISERGPEVVQAYGPVQTPAGCVLADSRSGPACACDSLDVRTRLALGMRVPLDALESSADFELLAGIGPARAAAIEAERRRAGAYRSAADLARRVPGIGPVTAAHVERQLAGRSGSGCGTPTRS